MTANDSEQRGRRGNATSSSRPSAKSRTSSSKRSASSTRKNAGHAKQTRSNSSQRPSASQKERSSSSSGASSAKPWRNSSTGKVERRGASGRSQKAQKPSIDVTPQVEAISAAGGKALSVAGAGVRTGARAVFSNRIATVIVLVIAALLVVGIVDTAANWGKAYGNVTVNGVDVGGMTSEQIDEVLKNQFAQRVSHSQVKIYASEKAQQNDLSGLDDEDRLARIEQIAQAEQISVEQATAAVTSWSTDALALKAVVPYEDLAAQAMAVGREDGGVFSRIGLLFMKHDIPIELSFDEGSLDSLASDIDRTIGDARVDATVYIEEGVATPVEGHDGRMVDRKWLASMLSNAMTSADSNTSFVAQVSDAPSRITFAQAQEASDGINRALQIGAVFSYKGSEWIAYGYDIGMWTKVQTVADGDGYKLGVTIDDAAAIPAVVSGAGAAVKSENVTIKFARGDEGIVVRTFGPGNIPEVTPAIDELEQALYGPDGIAWAAIVSYDPVRIEIGESDAPAALTLDQAIELGIVSVIGEYTTEFSDSEGTENRNHNIKLAADLLNDGIIEANGGTWSFNGRTGDTNEAAGFWAAGSIVEGEYVDSIGGGICQVATTVFNAVYESGLPINMRFCHTLYIASYPTGRDAAVSYPDLDLQWTNDLPSDVLLRMSYTDTSVTATLYSVHTGYSIDSIEGAWQDGEKYKTKFEQDSDLEKDEYYVKTIGVDGSSIAVTRMVYDEKGTVISDQTFDSNYDPKDEVIVVGPGTDTKKLERKDGETDSEKQSSESSSDSSGEE